MSRRAAGWAAVALAAGIVLGAPVTRAAGIDWVPVGEPVNPDDDTGFGGVAYPFLIGRTEVTNAQFAPFLAAVPGAEIDYSGNQILCSGTPPTCAARPGFENAPVTGLDFYTAARFANWLHNGMPSGPPGPQTTEDGAYTMAPGDNGILGPIRRNPGARVFLPNEDEWTKAAYYDPILDRYFDFPAGSDAPTACAGPDADTGNTANCAGAVGRLTPVGSYAESASPWGTFDQGGNASEWIEAVFRCNSPPGAPCELPVIVLRGGSFDRDGGELAAASRTGIDGFDESLRVGFRVAMVPEPGTVALLALAIGALGALRRRTASRDRP